MYSAIARGFKFNYEFTRFYFPLRKQFVHLFVRALVWPARLTVCIVIIISVYGDDGSRACSDNTIVASHSRDLRDVDAENRVNSLDTGSVARVSHRFRSRARGLQLFGFSCRARVFRAVGSGTLTNETI